MPAEPNFSPMEKIDNTKVCLTLKDYPLLIYNNITTLDALKSKTPP
jgi:hypothetical protein